MPAVSARFGRLGHHRARRPTRRGWSRRDSATWTVNGHPASKTAVQDLFAALADTARRTELVGGPARRRTPGSGWTARRAHASASCAAIPPWRTWCRATAAPALDGGYFRSAGDSAVYLVERQPGAGAGAVVGRVAGQPHRGRERRTAWPGSRSAGASGRTRCAATAPAGCWRSGGRADSAAVAALLDELRGRWRRRDSPTGRRRIRPASRDPIGGPPCSAPTARRSLTLAFDSTANGFWVRAARTARCIGWIPGPRIV